MGVTTLTMFHGQRISYSAHDWRVDGDQRRSNHPGINARSVLHCGSSGLWYVGAPRGNPVTRDPLHSALQQWTENLFRVGYVNSLGIRQVLVSWSPVPSQTNPRQIDPGRPYVIANGNHDAYRFNFWIGQDGMVYGGGDPPGSM